MSMICMLRTSMMEMMLLIIGLRDKVEIGWSSVLSRISKNGRLCLSRGLDHWP